MKDFTIEYTGNTFANTDFHHGRLKPAVGVHNYQVLRVNREHPEMADGMGWTYAPAPFLAYWNDTFYAHFYMNRLEEHTPPTLTMLSTSKDGVLWSDPVELFPKYVIRSGTSKRHADGRLLAIPEGTVSVMHQRMGFYTAPNGRFLALGYYSICLDQINDSPNDGNGIGRVAREIYKDGTFGDIFFVRYNKESGWGEENTNYPYYARCRDEGFREACDALLSDTLMVQQWIEECDRNDPLITARGKDAPGGILKAFCWYHLDDGSCVGLWKFSLAAVTEDEGKTWSSIVRVPSLVMNGAKVWGQKTSDGNYALVYNPSRDGNHRWPLAVVTGNDGLHFDRMLLVHPHIPPRRYAGLYKDFGPGYVRGIEEGNGTPPDGRMWLIYTMNKEDVWVSSIPVPIRDHVEKPVNDHFGEAVCVHDLSDWNIYSAKWAPVSIAVSSGSGSNCLELKDFDRYDRARADRLFPESTRVTLEFAVIPVECSPGQLFAEVMDGAGNIACRILFDHDGRIKYNDRFGGPVLQEFQPGTEYMLTVRVDIPGRSCELSINGGPFISNLPLYGPVYSVERISFNTGNIPVETNVYTDVFSFPDLARAGEPEPCAVYHLKYLKTYDHS